MTSLTEQIQAIYDSQVGLTSQQRADLWVQALGLKIGQNKNLIINPKFDLWTLGISFPAMASGTYPSPLIKYVKNGTMVHTGSQDTDVPTPAICGTKLNYSLKVDCTTAQASIGAGEYSVLLYSIEGYDYKDIENKWSVYSVCLKATKAGIYCISYRNSGLNRSYVMEVELEAATWTKVELPVLHDETGGTWDYTNGTGLLVSIALTVGTTFQGAANSWLTGNYFGTSNQVNACDSASNDFYIASHQFEQGKIATHPENRLISNEKVLLGRYLCPLNLTQSRMNQYTANLMDFTVNTINELRTTPTLTTGVETTDWAVATTAGAFQSGFSLAAIYASCANVFIRATKTTHGLTDGQLYFVTASGKNYLDARL